MTDPTTLDPLSPPINAKRLIQARTAAGLSQSDLARAIGVKPQSIQQLEDGSSRRTRHLLKIVTVLKLHRDWLLELDEDDPQLRKITVTKYAVYKGIVAAGLWQEENLELGSHPRIFASPNERYVSKDQVAYKMVGGSASRIVQDSEHLICVDGTIPYTDLRDRAVVIVERRRDNLIERTVRRVFAHDGAVELRQESDDPRHQSSLHLQSQESDPAVKVVAVAIGCYRDL